MDSATKEKAIDGVIEYLADMRFVCGKTDVAEFRLYAKAILAHSDLFVNASPDEIQFYVGYTNTPVETRREALTKEKAIEGIIEYLADMRFLCGKAEDLEFKPYMKAALTSSNTFTQEFIGTSPEQIQFYVDYANSPVEQRREVLREHFRTNWQQYMNVMNVESNIFFKGLSCCVSGAIKLTELEQLLKQFFPPELCDMALKKITEELGLNEVLKLEPLNLGLLPGSVAGADIRLRTVLSQRFVRENKNNTNYEQDLAVALWEISEGKNLDEFIKMLGIKHDPAEFIAMVREKARSACLRILRKTIADLPDIRQDLRKLETPGRELPLTDEVLATVPSKHDDLVEPSPADLLEHIGISKDNTSEAEWQVFMMFAQKVLDGELEVGSKTGLSISAALGKDASRVRKTISRYRERQLNR